MKKRLLAVASLAALATATMVGPRNLGVANAEGAPLVTVQMPEQLSELATIGSKVFDAKCAACHGKNGVGRDEIGPPLIHKIYEPSHHADEAFQRAAAYGVRAHHWRFGNMAPVEGITRAEVAMVIAYIREIQHENGIR